jgi:hypothetical protein
VVEREGASFIRIKIARVQVCQVGSGGVGCLVNGRGGGKSGVFLVLGMGGWNGLGGMGMDGHGPGRWAGGGCWLRGLRFDKTYPTLSLFLSLPASAQTDRPRLSLALSGCDFWLGSSY